MKTIKEFEIIDHGVNHCQYFQGCGVSMTHFDYCVTGIGRSFHEALENALQSLSEVDYDVLSSKKLIDLCNDASDHDDVSQSYIDCGETESEESELYYYASIRVKG